MLNCVPEGRLTGVGSGAGAGAGAAGGEFTVLLSATLLSGGVYLVESLAEELDLGRKRAEGFTAAAEGGARFEPVCGGLSPAGDPMVPAAAGVNCRLLITVLTPGTW